jgi:hypothetical protein
VGSVSGSRSPPREGHGLINHLQTGFIPPNRSLGAHPVVRAEHSVSSSMECRPASHDQLRRHHLVAGRACPSRNRARPACRTDGRWLCAMRVARRLGALCVRGVLWELRRRARSTKLKGRARLVTAQPSQKSVPYQSLGAKCSTSPTSVRVWFQGVIAQGGWWVDGALLNTFVDRLLLMTKVLRSSAATACRANGPNWM